MGAWAGFELPSLDGVVDDVTYEGLGKPMRPQLYVPWAQNPFGGAWIAVKTSGDPRAVVAAESTTRREAPNCLAMASASSGKCVQPSTTASTRASRCAR